MEFCLIRLADINNNKKFKFSTHEYQFEWLGEVIHVETPSSHILIIGTIQNSWFYTSEHKKIFEDSQYDEEFYCNLNGHFSLIIIDKRNRNIRLVVNRIGGNRLYYAWIGDELKISNRLMPLSTDLKFLKFNASSVKESLMFRWFTGSNSIINGIFQLQPRYYCDLDIDGNTALCAYWSFPVSLDSNQNSLPLSHHAGQVEDLLENVIIDSIKPNSRVAVLLSGGVDSSILAAITKKHVNSLVAISHTSNEHDDPELDTARQFAHELGIEHRVIEVSDSEILDAFVCTSQIIEQAPRNQSSLILYKMFEAMSGDFDQIIYGEAADTLFGSNMVDRFRLRTIKRKKIEKAFDLLHLRRFVSCLPSTSKIKVLLNETAESHVFKEQHLVMNELAFNWFEDKETPDIFKVNPKLFMEMFDEPSKYLNSGESLVKALILRGAIANHMHETVSLAEHFNMEIISPFVDNKLINHAAMLDDSNYYGHDYVKPILRRIGENYFTKELMYLSKKGFPVPHHIWTDTVLDPLWQKARQLFHIEMQHQSDTEFRWTMSGLLTLAEYFGVEI